jgi:hypothetical protein
MSKPTFDLRRACLALMAAAPFAAAPALTAAQQPAPEQQQQAADVDDATLDQFAEAFLAVQEIQAEASEELQAASDEEAAREVQQKAQEEMVEAVLETGLSVEDYNMVAQLMNSDPQVRDGVLERLDGHETAPR